MSYSKLKLTISFFSFILFSSISLAQVKLTANEIDDFKSQVIKKAEEVKTLQGDFLQTKHEDFLASPAESEGEFYYNNQKQLNWKYIKPFQMEILFTQGKLFLKENGKTREIEVSAYQMFDQLSELISESINGKIIHHQDFEISYQKEASFTKAVLTPKNEEQQLFLQIELYFNSDYLVEKIQLNEGEGSFVVIQLKDLQVNQPISERVFEVTK